MSLYLKLAYKELINQKSFSLFFLLSLTLGLLGLLLVATLKNGIQLHVQSNLKYISTADVVISSRFPFTEESIHFIESLTPKGSSISRLNALFSMVASDEQSILMRVVGIDSAYPLYGDFEVSDNANLLTVNEEIITQRLMAEPAVWLDADNQFLLDVKEGDTIRIGGQSFTIGATITKDIPSAMGGGDIAPKVYIGINWLAKTQLIQTGSRVIYYYLLQLPPNADVKAVVKTFHDAFNQDADAMPYRVLSYEQANNQIIRLSEYISGYLSLIGLIALFISAVGAAYLFRHYFNQRLHQVAILLSLGATPRETWLVLLLQLVVLGVLAACSAIALVLMLLPLADYYIEQLLQQQLVLHLGSDVLLMALFVGIMSSLVFCLPIMMRLRHLKPNDIFGLMPPLNKPSHRYLVAGSYLPGLFMFLGLAIWQSNFKTGGLFVAGLLVAIGVFSLFAMLFFWVCGYLSKVYATRLGIITKIALRNLYRRRMNNLSAFLAIALGAFLINISPQIYQGLHEEIKFPHDFVLPDYFLFDIQEEQIDGLQRLLQDYQTDLSHLSPNIQARMLRINSVPFSQYLEQSRNNKQLEEESSTFRRRSFNLSYRQQLANSERIVEGRPMGERYDSASGKWIEISVVKRFADRYGFQLGDEIVFDVLGMKLHTKIVNFRSVKWSSFQPNFFVLMQNGVLEDVPKSYIATLAGLSAHNKRTVRRALGKAFANISMIDVEAIIEQVVTLAEKMIVAITVMAYLSLLAGLVVIYAIARIEVRNRRWEMNLLKVLGANNAGLQQMIVLEFGLLALFSAGVGLLFSSAFTVLLSWQLFSSFWIAGFDTLLWLAVIVAVCILIAVAATHTTVRQKAWHILQSR